MLLLFVFLQIFKIDWWIDLQKHDVGVRANIVCLSSFSELAALLEKNKLALHLLTERTYIRGWRAPTDAFVWCRATCPFMIRYGSIGLTGVRKSTSENSRKAPLRESLTTVI